MGGMGYRCADCHEEEVMELTGYGSSTRTYICSNCASTRVTGVPGVQDRNGIPRNRASLMMERIRKTEAALPLSAMERALLSTGHEEAKQDLVALLTELGETG